MICYKRKKIAYTGEFSRNMFFSGNKDCTKTTFAKEVVRCNFFGSLHNH